jgi:hypothetical protein
MKMKLVIAVLILCLVSFGSACAFDTHTKISDVIHDKAFGDFGRFLFPLNTHYYSGSTLDTLSLTWYGKMHPQRIADAVIMQYTGLSEVTGHEPATYNCVGTNDGIADYHTMQRRIERIKANGTDTMIEIFPGLAHGFGPGEGTIAEGWSNNAISFWERNM